MINVSKRDEQGTKCSLTACRVVDIEETPPACFRDLRYPLWVVNTDLFVEYDSAGFVPKWSFDVMMFREDLIFYAETDVVYRIGPDMQRLWRIEKEKDPSTVPFYHPRLPVYSWMSGSITTNMYQFAEHTRVSLIRLYSCNTRILPYPAVSCRILPPPAVSCRILPYAEVSCRILPYPALSCCILTYPAVSAVYCRILLPLPYPAVCQ